jgi:hypothetical protein
LNVSSRIVDGRVWMAERERVRTLRVQRHLAIASLAGLALTFVGPYLDTLLGVLLFSLLVFLVLDALARAMDAYLGFMWGWLYGEPERTTRLDRIVHDTVQRLLSAQVHRRSTVPVDDPPVRVRPL